MEKEPLGHFLPCICTIDEQHMPAVSVVSVNTHQKLEVLIETVRVEFKTEDPMCAYQQAGKDYEEALSGCHTMTDINQQIRYIISWLKNKGYVLTPKTINSLIFSIASPSVMH